LKVQGGGFSGIDFRSLFIILADWKATMSRKMKDPDFDQTLQTLRSHSFEVMEGVEVAGGVQVSKYGAGAILVASAEQGRAAAIAVAPGALVGGQVARLLDRGYQKFLKTAEFEIPATAGQLQAIHRFSEDLKILTGTVDLYNEALGTTSDLYQYDRLRGREAAPSVAHRPWDVAEAH
jgi:hypothetical protein